LLKENEIQVVVDVRRFPTSKWEWFKRENLEKTLASNGIKYEYLGHLLGGFRKGGYVRYMETEQFKEGVSKLLELAGKFKVAMMCVEKIVFKCHRRFISRYLQQRGIRVIHIVDRGKRFEMRLMKDH
jgi:uncharacterized protein (DUF488 family)